MIISHYYIGSWLIDLIMNLWLQIIMIMFLLSQSRMSIYILCQHTPFSVYFDFYFVYKWSRFGDIQILRGFYCNFINISSTNYQTTNADEGDFLSSEATIRVREIFFVL